MRQNIKKKNKLIILGSGNSLGVPTITGDWGKCTVNKKNRRTRCSLYVKLSGIEFLIDTSPDLFHQILKNKIKKIDKVFYTHIHSDQTNGITDLETFYLNQKKTIDVYGDKGVINYLSRKFSYLFFNKDKNFSKILKAKIIKNKISFKIKNKIFTIEPIEVLHGNLRVFGYKFSNIAYLSDCSFIPNKSLKKLFNLNLLIIDCLKFKKHKCHLNFNEALNYIKIIKPKKTILTNMSKELDYFKLKQKLLTKKYRNYNISVGYDGRKILF